MNRRTPPQSYESWNGNAGTLTGGNRRTIWERFRRWMRRRKIRP